MQVTVKIIGTIEATCTFPVSNFLVHPFVGFTSITPSFTPQLEEVKIYSRSAVLCSAKPHHPTKNQYEASAKYYPERCAVF